MYHDPRCEVPSYCEPQPILHERIEEHPALDRALLGWTDREHAVPDYEILVAEDDGECRTLELSIRLRVDSQGTTPESCLEDLFDAAIDLFERAKARLRE